MENSLSKDLEEMNLTTSDEAKQTSITNDMTKTSMKTELGSTSGSTKQINGAGSSSSKGSSRKEPISTDCLKDMDVKYDSEFVVLKCENNAEVSVPVSLAVQSGMIKHALDFGLADSSIPLPIVSVSVLEIMMEYWKMHVGESGFDEEKRKDVNQWDTEFFMRIGPDALYDLLEAANYLDAKGLLVSGTEHVVELIKMLEVDQIRAYFGVKNDFTPEEQEQLNKDFPWID